MRVIVLAGLTGAGKTELLARLTACGEQTIDLEALAHHRGSVFGATSRAQPSHDAFRARVDTAFRTADPARIVWVEDTAPFIGSVGVPPYVQTVIETAPCVQVTAPLERRCTCLLASYGDTPLAELLAAIDRLAPRLGTERAATIRAALANQQWNEAVRALLAYYDAAYERRVARLRRPVLTTVDSDVEAASLALFSRGLSA